MIEVSHVTHHYGAEPVLRDISLSIASGELVALMGPNGMGKSTLVAVMAGDMWPINVGPSLQSWRLTGHHRTIPLTRREPLAPKQRGVTLSWSSNG